MQTPEQYPWWVWAAGFGGLFVGWLMLVRFSPAGAAMRDGASAVRRYPRLVFIPLLFAVSWRLWREFSQLRLRWLMEGDGSEIHAASGVAETLPVRHWTDLWTGWWQWKPGPALDAVLPVWEDVLLELGGLFHCGITTFPLSVPLALLFLFNGSGILLRLHRSFRARNGKAGWCFTALAVTAAICAVFKPLMAFPQVLARTDLSPWGIELLGAFAFLFEYGTGVFIQVLLILLVFHWIRGMTFHSGKWVEVGMRRFVIVTRWMIPVFLVVIVLTHVPLVIVSVTGQTLLTDIWQRAGILVLALFLIFFSTVEVTLIFHNETVSESFQDQLAFLRRHAAAFAWFLAAASLPLLVFHGGVAWLSNALGVGTVAALALRLLAALPAALLTGWLLASWICFYRNHEPHSTRKPQGGT